MRDHLPTLRGIDAVVTDPPYHLTSIVKRFGGAAAAPAQFGKDGAYARASRGFMGKTWDGGDIAFQPETWRLVFDAMRPGAHLAAFGGTRTYHRMAVAIEDAGFEIRDCLMWIYGTGFPKSHDVSKALDKMAGAEREVTGSGQTGATWGTGAEEGFAGGFGYGQNFERRDTPATPEARQWQGWGTALKPAVEPIVLARKPLADGSGRAWTVAENVLAHGTGALNIDACRIEAASGDEPVQWDSPRGGIWRTDPGAEGRLVANPAGRWPANVLHDGSPEVLAGFPVDKAKPREPRDVRKGESGADAAGNRSSALGAESRAAGSVVGVDRGDSGSAARFFYSAKAGKADRAGSKHPTVKPIALMRWLVRLITPPGGTVLDPFAGTGTTLQAALVEGFNAIGIEREAEYFADIQRRIARISGADTPLFAGSAA